MKKAAIERLKPELATGSFFTGTGVSGAACANHKEEKTRFKRRRALHDDPKEERKSLMAEVARCNS